MATFSIHLVAAATLVGAAALASAALAEEGAAMGGHRMDAAGMMRGGGMMEGRMIQGGMAGMCGEMMLGMESGGRDGRPNEQWRHHAPTPKGG